MKDEFEIELSEEAKTTSEQPAGLPMNFIPVGQTEPGDLKVYIRQEVYGWLERYSASDTTRELGSILLGRYLEEAGARSVVISSCIEAKYTDASASTLTFTHETWDYIHREQSRAHPDETIVGWQHTHPNYGIFLSGYDRFIQENFFNLPFQTAYVIDPVKRQRGFYQWKNGSVEKLSGFYIYDDPGKKIKFRPEGDGNSAASGWEGHEQASVALICLLGAVCVGLAVYLGILSSSFHAYQTEQREIQANLTETIETQKGQISELENRLAARPGETGSSQNAQDAVISFRSYTVQKGDTLYSICMQYGIDFSRNLPLILAVNQIDDPRLLQAGRSILLPIPAKQP